MKINILLKSIGIGFFWVTGKLGAAEEVDDFFDKSLVELAASPVSIATGSPKTVAEAASVVSVISAEQIKSMGATELHEVLETLPGVHASVQGLTGDYSYSVRGIQNATNSEVLFLLNGTRINTPFRGTLMSGTELPLEAIQQIEVIRGPGSALYGTDAFAGVINIITKKAKDIHGMVTGVRAGDHDTQSSWGQYGSTWAGWDIAASLQYQHTDGDQGRILKSDSQTAFDNAFGTHASHAPGALNTHFETFNAHLNVQRKHWQVGFWAFNDEGGTRAGLVGALDPKGVGKGQQYLGDVRFSTEDWLDNWEFIAHGSYQHTDVLVNTQSFPDNALLPIGSDGNINSRAAVGLVLFPDGIMRTVGQLEQIPAIELSSIYKGLDKHLIKASASFRHEQFSATHLTNIGVGVIDASILLPPPNVNVVDGTLTDLTGAPAVYLPDRQRSIWSYALQDEWQIANDWQLTAGLRYDEYSDFGGTFNPRAALIWMINPQLTSKLLYGKAFRAPNFSELGNQNNLALMGNPNLEPEKIDTYEWAFDYHPTHALRTAANFYYYQIEDHIVLVPDVGKPSATFQNTGKQDGYGTELEGNWQINDQWSLKGNYAWQHAVNRRTDVRVAGVPEHHVYAAAIWQFLPQWQLQSQLNLIGSRSNPIPENGVLADYQTVDFTLRGKKLFDHLTIAASLRNAFDTTPYEPAAMTIGSNLPMPGRSFYLEAALHF
ncbi:MAG: TonB-dependent receptor [Methylococcaceae bacterium]|nr:TonB-dependent receptor [Methylococcaceae bacterium]